MRCTIEVDFYKSRLACNIATITPNKPMAEPKISMMRIFTNSELFAASAKAAPEPTMPTQRPQAKFVIPTVRPAANIV